MKAVLPEGGKLGLLECSAKRPSMSILHKAVVTRVSNASAAAIISSGLGCLGQPQKRMRRVQKAISRVGRIDASLHMLTLV